VILIPKKKTEGFSSGRCMSRRGRLTSIHQHWRSRIILREKNRCIVGSQLMENKKMNWHKPDLLPAPAACRTRQPSASSAAFAAELARRRTLLASTSICRRARWDLRGSTSATLVGASMAAQRHSQAATLGITLTGAPRPHCRTRSKACRSCLTATLAESTEPP